MRPILRLILKSLALHAVCFVLMQMSAAQTTRALLIAVSHCDHADVAPLPFTVNDVTRLSETFRTRNEAIEVRVLGVDPTKQPTRNTIGREIKDWLVKESTEQDTMILYFSGHGYVNPEDPTATFLVSSDFDPERPVTGVPIDGLRKLLVSSLATNKFLIIDSCHAGAKSPGAGIDPLGQFANCQGIITLASAKFGEKSLVWEDRQMSLFSYWLNEGLKGHADEDKNTEISIDELYRYLFKNVVHCNQLLSRKETQTPVRIIGPDVAGIPTIVRLKPTALETLLDDIAEQIAMQLSLNRINRMGVLDFTIESQGSFAWTREQYALLQQYSAYEIEQRVKKRLRTDSYTVYNSHQTRDALTKSFDAVNNRDSATFNEDFKLTIQGEQVGAVMSGNLIGRQQHRFSMQCRLSRPMRDELITIAGGTATLSSADWTMLGISVDLLPLIRPEMENAALRVSWENSYPETQNENRESLAKSLGNMALDTLLGMPGGSNQLLINQLDILSETPHPLLNEEFPFQIEIWVKGVDGAYDDRRTPIVVGNELFVPLEKGEVYQIRIQASPGGDLFNPGLMSLAARVLVDGLNTFPEEDCSETDSGMLKYIQASRVHIDRATAWSIPWNKPLEINGFYTKPTSRTNAKYNEFQVSDAENSHAFIAGESDMKQIGLITVAFYPALTPRFRGGGRPGESIPRVGTKLGEQHYSEIEVRPCEKTGPLLSLLHLRYNTRENIEKLRSDTFKENNQ